LLLFGDLDLSVAQPAAVRDVTPPGMTRVHRSGDSQATAERGVAFARVRVTDTGALRLSPDYLVTLQGIILPPRGKLCIAPSGARWTCGQRSHLFMRSIVENSELHCSFLDPPQNTRATCKIASEDVAVRMLSHGWAELSADESEKTYRAAQEEARKKKHGLWSSDVPP
jgi:endonuclease YncB( thermonuclease family)